MKTNDRAPSGAGMGAAADTANWSLWADLEVAGELSRDERQSFEERRAVDPALALQHQELQALHRILGEEMACQAVAVDPAFSVRVMADLPVAPWEPTPAKAWAIPMAAMLVFGLAAAFLLGTDGASENSFLGIGFALFDFSQTAALAGAGLLAATWRGAGFGLEQLFAESGVNLVVLAAGVLMLNLLVIRMLRKAREPATAESETPRS